MMKRILVFIFLLLGTSLIDTSIVFASAETPLITQVMQKKLTPDEALQRLIVGNQRFVNHQQLPIDFIRKAKITAAGQYPGAVVLSCIDARVPPEIIFDQSIGNIFVTRVAANVISSDVLGGLEYATAVSGAKLIVVLGHDSCGAVKGACENIKLGDLTPLFSKIQPAVRQATIEFGKQDCNNPQFINTIATDNVRNVINMILQESPIIRQLVKQGRVKIVGAMYHLTTGKVTFLS